jgi:hypothetical protein
MYGIAPYPSDPLFIEDVWIPKQTSSRASAEADEDSMAEETHRLLGEGLEPVQFLRVHIHTHPQGVDKPSSTDLELLRETFRDASWGVICVLAKGGAASAIMCMRTPEGYWLEREIPVAVSWELPQKAEQEALLALVKERLVESVDDYDTPGHLYDWRDHKEEYLRGNKQTWEDWVQTPEFQQIVDWCSRSRVWLEELKDWDDAALMCTRSLGFPVDEDDLYVAWEYLEKEVSDEDEVGAA